MEVSFHLQVQCNLSATAVWVHQSAWLHPTHTVLKVYAISCQGQNASSCCFQNTLIQGKNLACYYRDGQTPYWFLFCLPLGYKILYSKNLDEGFGWVSSAESAHLTPDWVAGGHWVPRGLWHSVRTAELPGQLYLDLSFRLNFFSHYTAVWIPAHRHFTIGCQETVSWMKALMLWIVYWQKSWDSHSSYRQK